MIVRCVCGGLFATERDEGIACTPSALCNCGNPRQAPSVGRGNDNALTAPDNQNSVSLNQILDQIAARANAATGGNWSRECEFIIPRDELGLVTANQSNSVCKCYGPDFGANRDFIAASRSDVPALVKALRKSLEYVWRGLPNWQAEEVEQAVAQLLSEQTGTAADSVLNAPSAHQPPI